MVLVVSSKDFTQFFYNPKMLQIVSTHDNEYWGSIFVEYILWHGIRMKWARTSQRDGCGTNGFVGVW